MKKAVLAAFVSGVIATGFIGGVVAGSEHGVEKELSLSVERESDSLIKLKVGVNGDMYRYELTQAELNDKDLLAGRLSDLDQETRDEVINGLSGLMVGNHHHLAKKGKHGERRVRIVKNFEVAEGNEEPTVFVFTDGDDQVFHEIEIDGGIGEGDHQEFIRHIEIIGEHDEHIEIHLADHDNAEVDVVKRMLKNADLTAEELAELKALLDDKVLVEKDVVVSDK